MSTSNKGWIALHRQITEHWLWNEKPFSRGQAWIHMLLMANHEDNEIMFEGTKRTIRKGSFVTSIVKLSAIFGWERKKTTRFLDRLERDKMVTTERTTHGTTVTIVNWGNYQDSWTTHGTTEGITDGQPMGQPMGINNNDNNVNNKKKDTKVSKEKAKRFIPPTVEEVENYCKEKGYSVDANRFVDFYESKGWMVGKNKMKCWKAAVRTWVSKNTQNQERQVKQINFSNFQERSYGNMGDLEKRLLGL